MLKRTICVACKGTLMAKVMTLANVGTATGEVERQYTVNAIPDSNMGIKSVWCSACGLLYSVDALKVGGSNE